MELKPAVLKPCLFYVFEGKTEIAKEIKELIFNTLRNKNHDIVFKGPGEVLANEMSEMQRLIDIKAGLNNTYLEFSDLKSRGVKVLIIVNELSLEDKTSFFTLIIYPEVDKDSSSHIADNLSKFSKTNRITNLEKIDRPN